MPLLSIYLGSSIISAGLINTDSNSQQPDVFTTLPYPLLKLHNQQEQDAFLSQFLSQFLLEQGIQANFNSQGLPSNPDLQMSVVSLGVGVDSTLGTPIQSLYASDFQHFFCAPQFVMHGGKYLYAAPYPKFTTDVYNEEEKINVISNLSVYPFNFPSDEFSEGLYDENILFLYNVLAPQAVHAKPAKSRKESFKKVKELTFTGDRFTFYKSGVDSAYFLILSLLDDFGVFSIKIDTQNLATHALNFQKSTTALSDMQTSRFSQNANYIFDAGTIIKFVGPAECYFESEVGTKQLFQLTKNQIQIIPLAKGAKAKVTIKGSGFDAIEQIVDGGDLGVVFFNFERNSEFYAGLQSGFAKEIKSAIRENFSRF